MLFAICSCDPKWAERESNVEGTTKTGLSIRKIGMEIEFKPNVLEIFRDTQKSGVKTKLIMGGAQHLKIFDNYIQSVLSLSQRKTFRKLKGDRWKRVSRKWEKRKSSTNERDVKEARSMDGWMDGWRWQGEKEIGKFVRRIENSAKSGDDDNEPAEKVHWPTN